MFHIGSDNEEENLHIPSLVRAVPKSCFRISVLSLIEKDMTMIIMLTQGDLDVSYCCR